MPTRPTFLRRRLAVGAALLAAIAVGVLLTRGPDEAGRAAPTGAVGGQRTATVQAPHTPAATRPARTPAARGRVPGTPPAATPPAQAPIAKALGQVIVGTYAGAQPSASFLRRIRSGQLGGVILFAGNTAGGVRATRRAVDRLQAVAMGAGNAPLLVMIDQEGGRVTRLPGPPDRAAARMPNVSVARDEGAATGRLLRQAGVTMDLAPVADITRVSGSFLGDRSFGSGPASVAQRACAFAGGLRAEGVIATLKHFPGLGRAGGNTDLARIAIPDPAPAIRADWTPYTRCGGRGRTVVMVGNATYPALLGGDAPAVLSPALYARQLPRAGVPTTTPTISDDLDADAIRGRAHPAERALRAGLDLLLFARAESSSDRAYRGLLAAVRSGAFPAARVRDAAAAVARLKAQVPARPPG